MLKFLRNRSMIFHTMNERVVFDTQVKVNQLYYNSKKKLISC